MHSLDEVGKNINANVYGEPQQPELNRQLEQLALFLAETWKDEHTDIHPNAGFEQCIAHVTAELAKAATLVGGAVGLEILTGGGSRAARAVCRRIFSTPAVPHTGR